MLYGSLIVVNLSIHQAAPSPKMITDFGIDKLTIYSYSKCILIFMIIIIEHSSFRVIDHVASIINHKVVLLLMS